MSINDKLKLAPGESLRMDSSHSKGFMNETDETNYSVLNEAGIVVGTVEHTEHTAVRGFRVTNSVTQRDSEGKIVVNTSW